jgi:hypothetical protein
MVMSGSSNGRAEIDIIAVVGGGAPGGSAAAAADADAGAAADSAVGGDGGMIIGGGDVYALVVVPPVTSDTGALTVPWRNGLCEALAAVLPRECAVDPATCTVLLCVFRVYDRVVPVGAALWLHNMTWEVWVAHGKRPAGAGDGPSAGGGAGSGSGDAGGGASSSGPDGAPMPSASTAVADPAATGATEPTALQLLFRTTGGMDGRVRTTGIPWAAITIDMVGARVGAYVAHSLTFSCGTVRMSIGIQGCLSVTRIGLCIPPKALWFMEDVAVDVSAFIPPDVLARSCAVAEADNIPGPAPVPLLPPSPPDGGASGAGDAGGGSAPVGRDMPVSSSSAQDRMCAFARAAAEPPAAAPFVEAFAGAAGAAARPVFRARASLDACARLNASLPATCVVVPGTGCMSMACRPGAAAGFGAVTVRLDLDPCSSATTKGVVTFTQDDAVPPVAVALRLDGGGAKKELQLPESVRSLHPALSWLASVLTVEVTAGVAGGGTTGKPPAAHVSLALCGKVALFGKQCLSPVQVIRLDVFHDGDVTCVKDDEWAGVVGGVRDVELATTGGAGNEVGGGGEGAADGGGDGGEELVCG